MTLNEQALNDVLLHIRKHFTYPEGPHLLSAEDVESTCPASEIVYAMSVAFDRDFIDGKFDARKSHRPAIVYRLTWHGQEYLDSLEQA
jgi:hypothetical protein